MIASRSVGVVSLMVGTDKTSAPNSASRAAKIPACSERRVTTMRLPNSGLDSNQFNFSRSVTTSPMMVSAGGTIFFSATSWAMFANVPEADFCLPSVPC